MTTKIKIVCLGLLLVLCYSYGYGQDSLKSLNSYKYIYIIERGKPKDSVKVKQSYWEEKEIYTDSVLLGDNHRIVDRRITVSTMTAKGNYLDNMKIGTWQYFNWDNDLYKEVVYEHGHIRSVKYYNSKKQLYLLAVDKERFYSYDDTFHFEKYDKKGKIISEGDFPAKLISAGLNLPY